MLYIGVTTPGASLYIACGLISIVYGVVILERRQQADRGAADPAENTDIA